MLAKLDPEIELSSQRSAESALTAAQGQLRYARADFDRQRQLLASGHTPRARFDQSQKALQNAQSQVDNAQAQLDIAGDRVSWTTLSEVGRNDPPEAMRLGSTVIGSVKLETEPVISIPASALTEFNRQPAVWIVDPKNLTVSLRNIEVLRQDPGTIVIAQGLETGDVVVTAGVQALHPGQKVRPLRSSS